MNEREKKKLQEKNEKILLDMMKSNEKNQYCADCKTKGPRWASTNLGVFLCMPCAGLHRKMGTHISKVKSITLDSWTEEQIEHFQKWGNEKANALYNPHPELHPCPAGDSEMEQYIRNKYERNAFRDGAAKRDVPPRDSSVRYDASPERGQQHESSPALATLREMGWTDDQRNREVLARCRGDVNAAIEMLCSLPSTNADQQRPQQASGQQGFALAPPSRQQAAGQQSPASGRAGQQQQQHQQQQQQQQQKQAQRQVGGDLDLLGGAFAGKDPFGEAESQQQRKDATKNSIMSLFNTAQPVPTMGFGGPAFAGPGFGSNPQTQQPGFPGQQHPGFAGQQQQGFPGQQHQGFLGQEQQGFPVQQQQGFPAQQQQGFPAQQQGFPAQQQQGFPALQQQGFPALQQQQGFPAQLQSNQQQQGLSGRQQQSFPQQGLQQPGVSPHQMRNPMVSGQFGQPQQFQQPGFPQQSNPFQQSGQQQHQQLGGFSQPQHPGFPSYQQQGSYQAVPGPEAANQFMSFGGVNQQSAQISSQIPRQLGQQEYGNPQPQQIKGQQQQQASNQEFASLNPFGAICPVQSGGGAKNAGGRNPFT